MFTDRFIQIPISVYDQKMKDLCDKEVTKVEICRIDPEEICKYFATTMDDQDAVQISFRDGDSVVALMTMEEFEKLLNGFDDGNS